VVQGGAKVLPQVEAGAGDGGGADGQPPPCEERDCWWKAPPCQAGRHTSTAPDTTPEACAEAPDAAAEPPASAPSAVPAETGETGETGDPAQSPPAGPAPPAPNPFCDSFQDETVSFVCRQMLPPLLLPLPLLPAGDATDGASGGGNGGGGGGGGGSGFGQSSSTATAEPSTPCPSGSDAPTPTGTPAGPSPTPCADRDEVVIVEQPPSGGPSLPWPFGGSAPSGSDPEQRPTRQPASASPQPEAEPNTEPSATAEPTADASSGDKQPARPRRMSREEYELRKALEELENGGERIGTEAGELPDPARRFADEVDDNLRWPPDGNEVREAVESGRELAEEAWDVAEEAKRTFDRVAPHLRRLIPGFSLVYPELPAPPAP
jgi:hypothetical protein